MVFMYVRGWARHRYLRSNSLTGTVPAELSTLTTLTRLCATRYALSSSCARSVDGARGGGNGGWVVMV